MMKRKPTNSPPPPGLEAVRDSAHHRLHRPGRLALAGLALGLATGCQQGGGPPPTPPVEVEVIEVAVQPVKDRLVAVGTVLANEQVTVMPEAAGRIRTIAFTEGQRVKAGALLFALAPEKQQAQVAQAAVDLKLARDNAGRVKKLAGTRAISQQEVDQVLSQVTLREAALALQQERLKDLRITAPFAGILGPRTVSVGQFVNVGDRLVTLTDDSRVKVVYDVPERHLAELRTGQAVAIRVAAFRDRVFAGQVELINPRVDEATRTVQVRAVADNLDRLLRPGMFARVETITGTRPRAVVIPERALVPSLLGFAVYVVEQNGTNQLARLTDVKVGQRLPGQAEIRAGLAAGETIIVSGVQKVMDGAPVAPHRSAEPVEPVEPAPSPTAEPAAPTAAQEPAA